MTEQPLGGCEPILCAHLLRKVDAELIRLLASLSAEEWDLQTIAPHWKVRDVAAHLLEDIAEQLELPVGLRIGGCGRRGGCLGGEPEGDQGRVGRQHQGRARGSAKQSQSGLAQKRHGFLGPVRIPPPADKSVT